MHDRSVTRDRLQRNVRALGAWATVSLLFAAACGDGGASSEAPTTSPAPVASSQTGGASSGPAAAQTAAPASTPGDDAGPSGDAAATPPDSAEAGTDAPSAVSLTSICSYPDAAPIPYDHTYGIAGEYAMELAMSCDLGGFLAPLVELDPVDLSEVGRYVAELTDWLRARILACPDAPADTAPDGFLLVPTTQAAGLSRGDFRALVALFLLVVDRHDGLGDGLTLEQKVEARHRLEAWQGAAVQADQEALTHQSTTPDCTPTETDAGTG
jgi:hypothetical protein